ncbi:HAMP domain-containing protein [Candidatus Omnitrophota bacterium]
MPITQTAKPFRRRRYYVSRIQLKYIGIILTVSFGIALLCAYVVYYSSMLIMGGKLAKVYPQGMLVGIVKTVNIRILMSLVLVSPFVCLIGLFLSHRIAGPLFRIERSLGEIGKGDYTKRIVLRKKDELKSLAESINGLLERQKHNLIEERTSINEITAEIGALKAISQESMVNKDKLNAVVSRLDTGIAHLNSKLSQYKI